MPIFTICIKATAIRFFGSCYAKEQNNFCAECNECCTAGSGAHMQQALGCATGLAAVASAIQKQWLLADGPSMYASQPCPPSLRGYMGVQHISNPKASQHAVTQAALMGSCACQGDNACCSMHVQAWAWACHGRHGALSPRCLGMPCRCMTAHRSNGVTHTED